MEHSQQEPEYQLRTLGYRLTPQRQIILETLREMNGHVTPRQIYEVVRQKSSAIDRATIYRTMELFSAIGIVFASQMSGQMVYEMAEEVTHHHLVCRRCGRVQMLDDKHFHELSHHLWEQHKFKADIAHMTISGECGDCAAAAKP